MARGEIEPPARGFFTPLLTELPSRKGRGSWEYEVPGFLRKQIFHARSISTDSISP